MYNIYRHITVFVVISSMHRADVRICQSNTMGNIPRLHEKQDMMPMIGINKHRDLVGTKAIHPKVRCSKVVTKNDTLFSTIIVGRI